MSAQISPSSMSKDRSASARIPPNSTRTSSTDKQRHRAVSFPREPDGRNVPGPRRSREDSCDRADAARVSSIRAISRAERRSVVILFTTVCYCSALLPFGRTEMCGTRRGHGSTDRPRSLAASLDARGRWEAEPGRLGCGRTRKSGGCVSIGRVARRSISSARLSSSDSGVTASRPVAARPRASRLGDILVAQDSSPRSSATPRSRRRPEPVGGSARSSSSMQRAHRRRHRDGAAAQLGLRTIDLAAPRARRRDRGRLPGPIARELRCDPARGRGRACARRVRRSTHGGTRDAVDRSARGSGCASSSPPRTKSSGRSTTVYATNAEIDDALRDFEAARRGARRQHAETTEAVDDRGRRERAGRPGRQPHPRAGRARPRVRRPHRAAGRPRARPVPHRRRAARGHDAAGVDGRRRSSAASRSWPT